MHSPNSELELYDLDNDIGEEKNIAIEYPEVVKEITKLFSQARTKHELWGNKSSKDY